MRAIETAINTLIAQLDGNRVPEDFIDAYRRACHFGYRKSFQDNSMRDRLLLLNWLAVQTKVWDSTSQINLISELATRCSDLKLASVESDCVRKQDANLQPMHIGEGGKINSVNGDSLEQLYGSIKSKLKYIHSLDISRTKLLHKLALQIAHVYPDLTNCKHVKSLLVSGAINSAPNYDQEQQDSLKNIASKAQKRKENELDYFNWVNCDYRNSNAGSKKRSNKATTSSSNIEQEHKEEFVNEISSWSELQEELKELQVSGMVGELEEAMSHHMHTSGGLDLRAARGVVLSTDERVNHVVNLMVEDGESALINTEQKEMAAYSKNIRRRLRAVHEQCTRRISATLNGSIDHRFIQQQLPVRYAGTGPALEDIRRRHKDLLVRAAAACEQASPFQLKYTQSQGRSASKIISSNGSVSSSSNL